MNLESLEEASGFQIKRFLAWGDGGAVYLGADKDTSQKVILRLFSDDLPQGNAAKIQRDLSLAIDIKHSNVARTYSCGWFEDQFFLVQEYGEGSLADLIGGGTVLSKRALLYLIQAARGLAAMAKVGLYHGALKPSNFILSQGETLKVSDLALVHAAPKGCTLPDVGRYLAPEGGPDDGAKMRKDIYALGAVFYHILVGKAPRMFNRKRLRERRKDLPSKFCAKIERMMAQDPDDRYEDYDDLLRHLEGLAKEQGLKIPTAMKMEAAPIGLPENTDQVKEPVEPKSEEFYEKAKEKFCEPPEPPPPDFTVSEAPPVSIKGPIFFMAMAVFSLVFLVGVALDEPANEPPKQVEFKPVKLTQSAKDTLARKKRYRPEDSWKANMRRPYSIHNAGSLEPVRVVNGKMINVTNRRNNRFGDKRVNKFGMKLVWVEPDSFWMGIARGDKATVDSVNRVRMTRGFWISATEVTQEQYERVMAQNPSTIKGPKLPVTCVSWLDCQRFCKFLSKLDENEYRLPTEAEWEYACKASSRAINDDIDGATLRRVAWTKANSQGKVHAVATKAPNRFGIYDMLGNVAEICQDGVRKYTAEAVDPVGNSAQRALRGGSYDLDDQYSQAHIRWAIDKRDCAKNVGFRVVMSDECWVGAVSSQKMFEVEKKLKNHLPSVAFNKPIGYSVEKMASQLTP